MSGEQDGWRVARAQSAEADVRVMERWLQDTLVLEALLAGDQEAAHLIRVAAAAVREHRNDRAGEAREQRAAAQDDERADENRARLERA